MTARLSRTPINEAAWQQQLTDLLTLTGWDWNHTRRTIGRGGKWTTATSVTGWPDLTIWNVRRRSGLWAVELKTDTGTVTPDQRRVLSSLHRSGVPTFVWRPRDLDTITRLLTARLDPTAPDAAHLTPPHLFHERRPT